MLNVACVLKTGQFKNREKTIEYSPANVLWMKSMVEEHLTLPHKFICLSDVDIPGCHTIPLIHNWPGWWSKLELYRPGLFSGPVFYIDLDTVIVQNIDDLAIENSEIYFNVLRNLSRNIGFGSGLMSWQGDFSTLYDIFKANPGKHIEDYSHHSLRWGDQGFLQERLSNVEYWQDLYPGSIVSYYFDMHKKNIKTPPLNSKIIVFQGLPKPWDVKADWIPSRIINTPKKPQKTPVPIDTNDYVTPREKTQYRKDT